MTIVFERVNRVLGRKTGSFMRRQFLFVPCILFSLVAASFAVEYRVETLNEPPPRDSVSDEIVEKVSTTGFKVIRGSNRTVCEIWPCKQWKVKPSFKPSDELLYPFESGQLIGILRFPRRGSDFRDQTIGRGAYTLRYALQPTDGNHEGTSPTRDFLLLVRADDDKAAAPMDVAELLELSAAAAESSHPAMLCLQKASDVTDNGLSIRHDEANDWWLVHFSGKASANGKQHDVPVELIVAGHANE